MVVSPSDGGDDLIYLAINDFWNILFYENMKAYRRGSKNSSKRIFQRKADKQG